MDRGGGKFGCGKQKDGPPEMSISYSPGPGNVLLYMAKGT